MVTTNGIVIIFGAAGLSQGLMKSLASSSPDEVHAYTGEVLDILEKEKVSKLDTAEVS
jgi:hypothetical protein